MCGRGAGLHSDGGDLLSRSCYWINKQATSAGVFVSSTNSVRLPPQQAGRVNSQFSGH